MFRTLIENVTITLSCPATGDPDPQVIWLRNGEILHESNVSTRVNYGKIYDEELKITKIGVEHAGRYTCEARNKAGIAEQDIQLNVLSNLCLS